MARRILPHIDPRTLNLIVYHKDCTDGFGARVAAQLLLKDKADYIPAAYGFSPPNDDLIRGKRVGLFDFSYSKDVLLRMRKVAEVVAVIDHHKSAYEDLHGLPDVHFDMNKSGASLAWDFFYPDKDVPKLIQYIEDRDLWRFALPKSREFSMGFQSVPQNFEDFYKFISNESLVDSTIIAGSHIMTHMNTTISQLCSLNTCIRSLRGHRAAVVNSPIYQSEIGEHLITMRDDVDLGMVWHYKGEPPRIKVSLRSRDKLSDVSIVAKEFGGGGHRNAAGFLWNGRDVEEIFDKKGKGEIELDG